MYNKLLNYLSIFFFKNPQNSVLRHPIDLNELANQFTYDIDT